MSPKRFLLLVVLALSVAAIAAVPSAFAGDIADDPCFETGGPDTATCPAGTAGAAYSLQLKLKDGAGCGPGLTTWAVSSGTFPPGLSLESDTGLITGTPTEAGNFSFYVTVSYPVIDNDPPGGSEGDCIGGFSDKRVTLPINPGVPVLPKLTIGPESTTAATVGSAYNLQMTANLSDSKTWALSTGTLPPGLTLNSTSGLISGTPSAAGVFTFTVLATIDAQRSDTKTLTLAVRNPLLISGNGVFSTQTRTARAEVGVSFSARLPVTGGHPPYEVEQSGLLPDGIEFDVSDNSLSGQPETTGTYRFAVTVVDSEGRRAAYGGTITVAARLAITTRRLKNGRVGVLYRSKLVSRGGVAPLSWRIKAGPLPRGIRFDRPTRSFVGIPARAGTWVITIEIMDSLRVKTTATVVVLVKPARVRAGNR